MPQARLQPSAPISIVRILMSAPVATPSEQMKVSAMIRPNRVSDIRSIGSSTLPNRESESSDIMVQPASLKAWKNVNTDQKCWIREENSAQALDLDQFP